ncbi:MAG: choice-of-anchor tandem repeat GloVer-containing protein [Candidatus Sulfotelmatobacter sp.]
MYQRQLLSQFAFVIVLGCTIFSVGQAFAATENLIHSFNGQGDGGQPDAGLTPDGTGSFYGTTFVGGTYNCGVVYKLTHTTSGWAEVVLYSFKGGSSDGGNPSGQLAIDSAGNIYGTTRSGGKGYGINGGPGYGILYQLSPTSAGWTETVLHFFFDDGATSGLIIDAAGSLYGETGGGGASLAGTIYQMKRDASAWEYRTLYNFQSGNDGQYPSGGLIFDAKGNLYGTTILGGRLSFGTVFELQHANDTWSESLLYTFQSIVDGVGPQCALVFDADGNLYGTTAYGGDTSCANGYGCGEVFELSPSGDGVWSETTLYGFTGSPDGHSPLVGLTRDGAGDLFGTTSNGGTVNAGALFELQRQTDGSFAESIVYSFNNNRDGGYPSTPLTLEGTTFFGTTGSGGENSQGVVFAFPGLATE